MTISAYAAPVAKLQFTDNSGAFLAGGLLFTYLAGTTTKATTYVDAQQATPNTNPIVLDSEGRCTAFLPPGTFYKFTLSPSTDTDPPTAAIWTVDNLGVAANGVPYAVDTGTANALLCAAVVGIPLTANAGTSIVVKALNTITGACTLAVTATGGTTWGAISIKDANGNDPVNGAIVANQPTLFTYDGTFWRMQSAPSGLAYAVDSGVLNAMVATVPTLPSTARTGANFLIKAAFANNASATVNVNGWGAITIKDKSGSNLGAAAYAAAQVFLLTYDGTNWRTLF